MLRDSKWSQGPETRQEDSRTSTDVSRPGIEPGSQELASCGITARPPQHDATGPHHRAFDVFQGSCDNHQLNASQDFLDESAQTVQKLDLHYILVSGKHPECIHALHITRYCRKRCFGSCTSGYCSWYCHQFDSTSENRSR